EELRLDYESRGMRIESVAEGFAFRSNPAYGTYVRSFLAQRPIRLSRAQLETMAIIAYRQPITRPEIDDVRGVDSGPVLKTLLERELVRMVGKKDEPGRPILYGTTQQALEFFNLQSLSELPTLREFTELSDESRQKFAAAVGQAASAGPVDLGPEAASAPPPSSASTADAEVGSESAGSERPPEAEEDSLTVAEATAAVGAETAEEDQPVGEVALESVDEAPASSPGLGPNERPWEP